MGAVLRPQKLHRFSAPSPILTIAPQPLSTLIKGRTPSKQGRALAVHSDALPELASGGWGFEFSRVRQFVSGSVWVRNLELIFHQRRRVGQGDVAGNAQVSRPH